MICTILGFLLSVYLLATEPKLMLPLAYGHIEQQLPIIQLPPGAVAIPPSQQHSQPSQAQIQSDIAKLQQQGIQYASAMTNLLNQRLGNDTSTTHTIQVLKQMTAEGKINCPTPITNPGHCFLTPKPPIGSIAPPIPPFANYNFPIPPPDLGMGAVTDCIYTGYGVFCPTN